MPTLKKIAAERKALEAEAYGAFLSETAWRRKLKQSIPKNAVTMELPSKWGRYTGYAPAEVGTPIIERLAELSAAS